MDGSNFRKDEPQPCKIGIKNEVKAFYFGDHIRAWTVISKKKFFALFSNKLAARGFNSFSKSGPSCEKLAHPWSRSMDGGLSPKRYTHGLLFFVCIYDVAVTLDRFPLSKRCCTGLLVCFYKTFAVNL